MHRIILLARIALAFALAAAPSALHAEPQRPNILIIVADDMGINDLGHINGGQTRTPNLDRLAAQGVSFQRHYTESSCSTSRAALLTGMNPTRVGFHPVGLALPADIATLPELLRRNGYHTALFGKWHVGDLLRDDGPDKHGFDEWFGMLSHFYLAGAQQNGHLVGRRPVYIDPWLQSDRSAPQQYKGHIDDILTERVIAAIARKRNQPWFIYAAFLAPHTPTIPGAAYAAKYPDTPNGRYRALIEQLDHNVGAILRQVQDSGQADRTIVIFVSDNGGTGTAFPSNAPLDGSKATYAEGGIRAPLIVHWPGHWAGGKRIDDVKYIADIYPTLADALQLNAATPLDGENLFGRRKKPLFWYSQNIQDDSWSVLSADGRWRLMGNNTVSRLLQYNGTTGLPREAADPAVQARMLREYIEWRDATTLLPNAARTTRPGASRAVANALRPTFSLGLSFVLPPAPSAKPVALVGNRQLDLRYENDEFVLRLDATTLRFPYRLQERCNSILLNFVIAQDNTIFYGEGISQVKLYVNGQQPITRSFKIDRIDSANFSLLTMDDFNTQPRGPIVAPSIALATRIVPASELEPALDSQRKTYCEK